MICYMTTSSSQTLKMGICKTKGQMVAWLAVAGLTLEFTDARGGMDGCDMYDILNSQMLEVAWMVVTGGMTTLNSQMLKVRI